MTVIVFVHGLDGTCFDGWGTPDAPGAFITRIGAALPQVAVALWDYPSKLKRIVADRTLGMDVMAADWAEALRERLLPRYSRVAIVAHCLGGLLTTISLRMLLTADAAAVRPGPLKDALLLFSLDVPFRLPADGPSDWLAGLLAALRLDAGTFAANAAFWRRWVLRRQAAFPILAYAVTSAPPGWVSPLGPDADLPRRQVCQVDITHTELIRAAAEGAFEPHDFVLARLRDWLADAGP